MHASQLQHNNPALWPTHAGWSAITEAFFASPQGQSLLAFLAQRLAQGAVIFPPEPLRALALTAPDAVHTVILGQDPYHGRGQGEGLAFSVAQGVRLPPSLRNIFKEIERDLGQPFPPMPAPGGSLVQWAQNGTLLLNTCLTVEEGQAASHAGKGWEGLTDAIISHVAEHSPHPVAFMLWGAHAQSKQKLIAPGKGHLVLTANHPSPLSALRPPLPFIGCGHFSAAQRFLQSQPGQANTQPFALAPNCAKRQNDWGTTASLF